MEEWKKVEEFEITWADAWMGIRCPNCKNEFGLEIDDEEKACKKCGAVIRAISYLEIKKTIDEKKGEHS